MQPRKYLGANGKSTDGTRIEMTNTEETEQSKDKQSIWDEAINLCRMRTALKTSAKRWCDNVD